MKYPKTWQKIFDRQSEILDKELKSNNTHMHEAADYIIKYRKKLLDENADIDIITQLSLDEAEIRADSAFSYDREDVAQPFATLKKEMDVFLDFFNEIALNEDECCELMSDLFSRRTSYIKWQKSKP